MSSIYLCMFLFFFKFCFDQDDICLRIWEMKWFWLICSFFWIFVLHSSRRRYFILNIIKHDIHPIIFYMSKVVYICHFIWYIIFNIVDWYILRLFHHSCLSCHVDYHLCHIYFYCFIPFWFPPHALLSYEKYYRFYGLFYLFLAPFVFTIRLKQLYTL